MTVDLELYPRFMAFLRAHARGEAHAITAKTLCPALGLEATPQARRHLRACAQHASASGDLVCSGNAGYYVPASADEARGASARLRAEAFELLKRADQADRLTQEAFAHGGPRRPVVLPLFSLLEAS